MISLSIVLFLLVSGGLLVWAKRVQKRRMAALNPTNGGSGSSMTQETAPPSSNGVGVVVRSGLTEREVQMDAARARVQDGLCLSGCGERATHFLPCPTLVDTKAAFVYKAFGVPVPRRYVISDSFGPEVARTACKLHAELAYAACERYVHDTKGQEAALIEGIRVRMAEWQKFELTELLVEQAQTARRGGPSAKRNRKVQRDNVVPIENRRKQQGEG